MIENRLKEIRERAGLSQVQLGYKAKVAPQNISAIENGRLAPWEKVKRKLARVLKTNPEELFPKDGTNGN